MTEQYEEWPVLIPLDPITDAELVAHVTERLQRAMRKTADEIRALWRDAPE